jgi:translation initiation factor IF-2
VGNGWWRGSVRGVADGVSAPFQRRSSCSGQGGRVAGATGVRHLDRPARGPGNPAGRAAAPGARTAPCPGGRPGQGAAPPSPQPRPRPTVSSPSPTDEAPALLRHCGSGTRAGLRDTPRGSPPSARLPPSRIRLRPCPSREGPRAALGKADLVPTAKGVTARAVGPVRPPRQPPKAPPTRARAAPGTGVACERPGRQGPGLSHVQWGGRGDLNPRPPGPQPGALTN